MNKEGSFRGIFIVMFISVMIALFWESFPVVKNFVHLILDPTAGVLLQGNLTMGMLFVVLIISLIMTLTQKYLTDQKTLREMKKEQKELQEEMKKLKENPEKLMELQKKQLEFLPKMMKVSMRSIVYTAIPLILFFRWFMDFFSALGDPKFFGFLSWFWFYLLGTLILGAILRKIMNVV